MLTLHTNLFQLTILPDVIIFTETWLKPSTLDSDLASRVSMCTDTIAVIPSLT